MFYSLLSLFKKLPKKLPKSSEINYSEVKIERKRSSGATK
jgi:hypothetical protein